MPSRIRKKYRKKRTRRRRRTKYAKANRLVVRGPSVVPDEMMIHMDYCDHFSFVSGAGVPAYYVFKGNSIYDPDHTSAGHQPLGRDQWNNFYTRYEVMASSIEVEFCSNQTVSDPIVIAICPTDAAAPSGWVSSLNTMLETPYSKSALIPGAANGQGIAKSLSYYMTTKAKFGDNKNKEDLQAQFGNNPNEIWYHQVAISPTVGVQSASCSVRVKLKYYVKLFDRVDLAGS